MKNVLDIVCRQTTTSTLEVAFHPKRDMDADELIDTVIENEAVRPKCDMDAEKSVENKNENDAVRSKCNDEAEAVDEDAKKKQEKKKNEGAAAKTKYLKIRMKFQMKMWRLEGLSKKGETVQRERNNT